MRIALAWAPLLLLVGGCNDDSGADVIYPGCLSPNELALEGNVDGQTVRIRTTWQTLAFVNADPATAQLGTLDVSLAGGDSIHVAFANTLANGATIGSRGAAVLTAAGGPVVGNCDTGSFAGLISMDQDGSKGTFLLAGLRYEPFCSGPILTGDIRGCFVLPPSPPDAGPPDASVPDAGPPDAAPPDAGFAP